MTAELLSQETTPTDKPPAKVPVPLGVRSSTGFSRLIAWILCLTGIIIFSIGSVRLSREIHKERAPALPRPMIEPLPGQTLVRLSVPSGSLKAIRP